MLRRVGGEQLNTEGAKTTFAQARFPAPFPEGLEYSSPARGCWNIVHTGMLIPESHQIFVCAKGCLRGVVLTAAEMNALDRYSAIEIREENVIDGGMEELMIDGAADVIEKLPYRPRAILLFISCQHFFLAYDRTFVFETLRARFPDIRFVDCYMIPTLRKSGLTPDQKMRIQMYRMWEPLPKNPRRVNLIGSNLKTDPDSELVQMVTNAGFEWWDLYRCRTFDDYMSMAGAALNLAYEPMAVPAMEDLKERLGQDFLYLTFSYDFAELEENYGKLAKRLGIEKPDFSEERERALAALASARELIGDTPIAVDYTFTFRVLSFARLLLEQGFHVTEIFADAFLPEDEENFRWLQTHFPNIVISATNRPKMRFLYRHASSKENRGLPENEVVDEKTGANSSKKEKADTTDLLYYKKEPSGGIAYDCSRKGNVSLGNYIGGSCNMQDEQEAAAQKTLAIGQKAAYFCGTDYFVNVAESGGYFGYVGIQKIARLMCEAFLEKKDRRSLIQKKGFGCESCI